MRRVLPLLVALGCSPGAVGPRYRGEALFTVKGQLVTSGPAPTTPIRLAVAWYPDERTDTAPKAIVTQDVEYQGSFPLNYSFGFFTVPEREALHEYLDEGVVTRAAFGVLLAYEDRNGNGKLDTIGTGGGPIDRVLGTSVGDTYNGAPAPAPVWVAYVEGTPPADWVGYGAGYNLYQGRAVVPADTQVPVVLTGSNELNFFVCEEFISGSAYGFDLPCSLPPTGGVRVIGNLYRHNGFHGGSLRITDGKNVLSNVTVTVNDAGVPFDPMTGLYVAPETMPLTVPGVNVVTVTPPAGQPLRFTLEAAADFSVQTPAEGFRHLAGTPLAVQWTRSSNASFYQVQAYPLLPPNTGVAPVLVPAMRTSTSLSGLTNDDTYQVLVTAFAPNYLAHGPGGSLVNLATTRAGFIDVLPQDVGLWLEGAALISSYQGQRNGSAWLEAFEGVTAIEDALVTANGEPLPFDRASKQYGGVADVEPGASMTLAVVRNGQGRKAYTVDLPGDFTVTALPATQPARTPLKATWSPAPFATEYRLFVSDASGRQLHFSAFEETEATVPGLAPGTVTVTISAVRRHQSRHLIGMFQQSFELTIVP